MACVLVHIEVEGDGPTPASLSALGDGRRIASTLGATLYAVVLIPTGDRRHVAVHLETVPTDPSGDVTIEAKVGDLGRGPLVSALGTAGADKVVLATADDLGSTLLWATAGAALSAVCDQLEPALVLFAATSAAADVAPRLAARLGAAFAANAVVETGPRGEVVFSRSVFGGGFRRRLALDDLDRAAVVTLPVGHRHGRGRDEAELMVLDVGGRPDRRIEPLERSADGGALESARVVVTGGGGVHRDAWPLVSALAAALGGEVGATRTACERGLAPPTREIGMGARQVRPELYVVCGASGSAGHLGAVSPDAEIVAIDRDPDAPIFRAASYGLVGAIEDVVPQLIAALRGRP